MVSVRFWSEIGYRFWPFWSEIGYVFHSGLALGILFTRNYFFCINIGKFVALLKCLRKWKPFLVSCGHILEPCTNFRGLKSGIDFLLRSEIGYGESLILVWNRVQVWRSGPHTPTKNFVEYSRPPSPTALGPQDKILILSSFYNPLNSRSWHVKSGVEGWEVKGVTI